MEIKYSVPLLAGGCTNDPLTISGAVSCNISDSLLKVLWSNGSAPCSLLVEMLAFILRLEVYLHLMQVAFHLECTGIPVPLITLIAGGGANITTDYCGLFVFYIAANTTYSEYWNGSAPCWWKYC